MKKTCYLFSKEYYAFMKNEILSFSRKWMELENTVLSEISPTQKEKCCMFSLTSRS
jgi:hypothetical protein